jgi:hypothetical protein
VKNGWHIRYWIFRPPCLLAAGKRCHEF